MRKPVILTVALLLFVSCRSAGIEAASKNIDEKSILISVRKTLDAQTAAWNRGDIRGFMDGYRKSRDTTFVSGTTLKRGHKAVLDGYLKNYPAGKQGTLQFHIVEIHALSADSAYVLGRYELAGTATQTGFFTLVLRREGEGFVVVHDHTAADGPPPPQAPKVDD
ncbi:MAG: YybH family protein [Planctomycetota bacterium]